MSRKSKRNQPAPATVPPPSRGKAALWIGSAAAVLVAVMAAILVFTSERAPSASAASPDRRAQLEREGAPTIGPPDARVHIVEFMDPACEACASFYPFVKKLMADNPGRIKLTVRHVPFHKGADEVVKMLEASRQQDKYWPALEMLLSNQDRWTINHVARPDRALPGLEAAGVDPFRLHADMGSPAIAARMKQDMEDARALGVTKTPEYFVNGRQMPSFGYEQLATLVRDELKRAYP